MPRLNRIIIPILFLFIICFAWSCGQQNRKTASSSDKWYRGNTHTHARFSDENDTNDVPEIAKWYREAGYDFLVLSEHNDHLAEKKVFCHDEASEPPEFLMLCGLELSNSRHITALGIDRYIGDETSLQDGVQKIIAAGGIPVLNHPQSPVISSSAFIATQGLNHLEIVNGGRLKDTPASEMLWDSIMSAPGGRVVYAVGADDNHYRKASVARGWIMVRSESLNREEILESIRDGNYYVSTGIILDNYSYTSDRLSINSQNGDSILFIGKSGTILGRCAGRSAEYEIKGDELYIRAKIFNDKGLSAWTQPLSPRR